MNVFVRFNPFACRPWALGSEQIAWERERPESSRPHCGRPSVAWLGARVPGRHRPAPVPAPLSLLRAAVAARHPCQRPWASSAQPPSPPGPRRTLRSGCSRETWPPWRSRSSLWITKCSGECRVQPDPGGLRLGWGRDRRKIWPSILGLPLPSEARTSARPWHSSRAWEAGALRVRGRAAAGRRWGRWEVTQGIQGGGRHPTGERWRLSGLGLARMLNDTGWFTLSEVIDPLQLTSKFFFLGSGDWTYFIFIFVSVHYSTEWSFLIFVSL